jgi:hypothetical protein
VIRYCFNAVCNSVARFGLQTEQIMLKDGDQLDIIAIFKDLDAGKPVDSYNVHSLAGAIKVSS